MGFDMGPDGAAGAAARAGVSLYSDAMGRAVCARVAAGESLRRIGAQAGWPTPQTVWKWARGNAAFAEALSAAQRAARTASRLRDRAKEAVRPGRRERWRKGGHPIYCEALAGEVCRRLIEGESLIGICRDADMPAYSTVYEWVKKHPEFERAYVAARRLQGDWLFDEGLEVTRAATPGTVFADRLRFDGVRWAAARLAPTKYVERLLVDEARAQARVEAPLRMIAVSFKTGPAGEVLVAPPRCEAEAEAWERAYGKPYDGPGLLPGTRGPGPFELLEDQDYLGAVIAWGGRG